ncbi:GNS1/SUR4 family domain-containing protein [Phthorimaea operculella]|nr:GNS1/SUR4 family domain-containing protein [Phthorimaea operculella]
MESLVNTTVPRSLWSFKGYDDFIDEWTMMGTPFPILTIFAAYLLFVLKLGPDFMKKRPPFSLNNVLLLYNVVQVAVSVYVFFYGIRLLFKAGLVDTVCELDKQNIEPLAIGIWMYFLAKLSELLDTIFFVLRKKDNQVTFLHVYHHATMVLATWYTLKYEPTYTIVFLGTLNTFVHIVMYSYYALSTFPSVAPYLWWKKYITTMQLVQFCLMGLQVAANTYITGCRPSSFLLSLIFVNIVLMLYLFTDFYMKAYSKTNAKKSQSSKVNNGESEKSDIKFSDGVRNVRGVEHEKSL